MSKWKQFKGQSNPVPDISAMGIPVSGSFRCQLCPEVVDDAEYFQVSRVLRWKCPEGHVSLMEKFDL